MAASHESFTAERWSEIGPMLDALLDAPESRRGYLLTELARGDPERRQELERLFAECQRPHRLLDQSAADRFAALLDEPATVFPPSLAERYRPVRELARGGMATVYLAHDIRHDRDVALKVMRPELSLAQERFLREVTIAAKLRHPNVVPLFDSGDADGALYYVMPYEAGQSLRDRLDREGPLPIADVVAILQDICDALIHAHHHGIVHRDIKPDNVLLSEGKAMVTDFGVARAISASSGPTPFTTGGIAMGTPGYMAPEQITADARLDHRADIYALGVVGYELLTGQLPFTGSVQQVIAGHLADRPRAPSALRAELPPALDQVLLKCLAKQPADRWQDAEALREALTQVASGQPLTDLSILQPARADGGPGASRSPSPLSGDGPERRLTKRPLARAAGGVVALALLALAAWELIPPSRGASEPDPVLLGIGILPATAASPGGELDWLARGLPGQLSTELTGLAGLDLRPIETIAATLGIPLDSVARAHDVDYFIRAGLSALGGDSMAVTVELIENGIRSVRAGSFVAPSTTTLQLVGRNVAEAVRPMLGARVRERQLAAGTNDRQALQHARRGDQYRLRGRQQIAEGDPAGAAWLFDSAAAELIEAEQRDRRWLAPRLARAALGADRTLLHLGPGRVDSAAIRRVLNAGIAIVDSALSAHRGSAVALAMRGRLRWHRLGLAPEAPGRDAAAADSTRRDLEEALARDTTLARAAADLSHLLAQESEFAEATRLAERAYRLDAFMEEADGLINLLATSNLEQGHDAAAIQWCTEGRRRFPANPAHVGCFLEVMAWGALPVDADTAWRLFNELDSLIGRWNRGALTSYRLILAAALARAPGVPLGRARAVLAKAGADAAEDSAASTPLRSHLLGLEAAVLYRLGDGSQADSLLAELRRVDSTYARSLETRRQLRNYLGPGRRI